MIEVRIPHLLVTAIALSPYAASAQNYPLKTVRILVPTAPGGGSDSQARLLARRFNEAFGQSSVVDNRPGGSGVIGAELVARAPADGYTILFGTAQIAISQVLLKKVPFDMTRDFAAISQISTAAQYLMV